MAYAVLRITGVDVGQGWNMNKERLKASEGMALDDVVMFGLLGVFGLGCVIGAEDIGLIISGVIMIVVGMGFCAFRLWHFVLIKRRLND